VDGASTDGTVALLHRYSERITWWLSEPDRGVYDAWNKALPQATGEWIVFLGADDWLPEAEHWVTLRGRLEQVPADIRVAYGRVRRVSPTGKEVAFSGESWDRAGPAFTQQMSLPHQGVFHRRELFADLGPFDPTFRIAGDYELLLRELPQRKAFYLGDDTIVSNMTVGGLSLHGQYILDHVREIRRARQQHGVYKSGLADQSRFLRAWLRATGHRIAGPRFAAWCADLVRVLTGRCRIWTVK
jgi:glycosyltransferase involved in cell wall biosynthesis